MTPSTSERATLAPEVQSCVALGAVPCRQLGMNVTPRTELKKERLFQGARVAEITPEIDEVGTRTGTHVVRMERDGEALEVRFREQSGEFHLVEDDAVELTTSELRDLAAVVGRYNANVPWRDSVTASVLSGINDAIFPRVFAEYRMRSVTQLGRVILLTGSIKAEHVDVVLDTVTQQLTVLLSRGSQPTRKRAISAAEAFDLAKTLKTVRSFGMDDEPHTLVGSLIDAARRRALS